MNDVEAVALVSGFILTLAVGWAIFGRWLGTADRWDRWL